ncbi:hypothetical protein FBZ86_13716 [Gluconacetobacter diazotrophicus]|nr:hypothetical protein FBZ86_13716 [Gluconacetobacter diazotrophicus]
MMTNETTSELVIVRLPLTDEKIEAFVQGSECGSTPDETIRAIGTPVEASGLETVGYGPSRVVAGWAAMFRKKKDALKDAIPLVHRTDAEALIAARDAEIAELRARLETIAQETREACAKIIEQNVEATALRGGRRFLLPRTDGDQVALAYAAAIRSAGEKV